MARNPTEQLFDKLKAERDRVHIVDEPISYCVACGEPIDYCQGHGEIGDPAGFAILVAHDNDDHDQCDPHGCDEGEHCAEGPCAHPSHGDDDADQDLPGLWDYHRRFRVETQITHRTMCQFVRGLGDWTTCRCQST